MRSIAVLLAFIGVILYTMRGLAAQDSTAAPCTFDTAAHLRTDTAFVSLAPGARLEDNSGLRDEYLAAAQAIRTYYIAPTRLVLPIWARTFWTRSYSIPRFDHAPSGFDGDVRFQLDTLGRVVPDLVFVQSLHPDFAASVMAAIYRADSARAFLPPSRRLQRDHGMIQLHFDGKPRGKEPRVMLLRVIIPSLRVDKPPSLQFMRSLRYPEGLRGAKIAGRVVLQFVLDANGRPDTTTVSVIQGAYREFAFEAIDALKTAQFRPTFIEHCAVPSLVQLPFDYRIGSRPFLFH